VSVEISERGGQEAAPRWMVLTAPGMVLTRSLVAAAVIVAPWVTPAVHVAITAGAAAVVVVLVNIATAVTVLRRPSWWSTPVLASLLAADPVLSGILLGAERQPWGVGTAAGLVALALGFEAGGWMITGACAALIALGCGIAVGLDVAPLIFSPMLSFSTALSVETSFAGVPAVLAVAPAFRPVLQVETSFGGVPGVGSTLPLFLPAMVIALGAVITGGAVNLTRAVLARRAAAAPSGAAAP